MIGEARQTTSNIGYLNKPSIQALIHGLNRHYYSINISYRRNKLEEKMLLNLHKKSWNASLTLPDFDEKEKHNETTVKALSGLTKAYQKMIEDEKKMTPEQLAIANVGKLDAKRHLEEDVERLMADNIKLTLGTMLDSVAF